jgi:hypothetical protein
LAGAPGRVVDGGVGLGPVDGQAEVAARGLECLLVLGGEPVAQLDEVLPGDGDLVLARVVGRLEAGVVVQ